MGPTLAFAWIFTGCASGSLQLPVGRVRDFQQPPLSQQGSIPDGMKVLMMRIRGEVRRLGLAMAIRKDRPEELCVPTFPVLARSSICSTTSLVNHGRLLGECGSA
jgi:hypothetical protein